MKWIRKLLGLCEHHWEVLARYMIRSEGMVRNLPVGEEIILQCKHCGNVKQKIFRT